MAKEVEVVADLEAAADAEEIEQAISSPRRWTAAVILLLAALAVQRVASLLPNLVEVVYSRAIYYRLGRIISTVNQAFSFSVAEVLLWVLILALLIWLGWLMHKVWYGYLDIWEMIAYIFYRLLWASGAVLLLFFLFWGFNYLRAPLAQNFRMERRETLPGELEAISTKIVNGLNDSYDQARRDQGGVSGARLSITRPALYGVLERSFQSTAELREASHGGFSNPKPLYLSALLSRFGISGIYSPFTGEANYNDQVPECDLPYVVAHEKAHQRGFAREDEANFVAFLTCIRAGDPFVRYSGYLQALRVLNVLRNTNAEQYQALTSRIGSGPLTDLQQRAQFWQSSQDPVLSGVARRTNDTYLRVNRVRSGIANYDDVTTLIINYFLKTGGNQLTEPVNTRPRGQATPARTTVINPTPTPTLTPTLTPTPLASPRVIRQFPDGAPPPPGLPDSVETRPVRNRPIN